MGSTSKGIVFCATGARYVAMARAAAEGVRKYHPDLPCDLFTEPAEPGDGFDRVVHLDQPARYSKIEAMLASRFDRSVFLDADVFITNPLGSLFDVLERFDIALAQDSERNSAHGRRTWRTELPASFPQYNTGVIAYRRSDAMQSLLTNWLQALKDADGGRDQPSLRELLWLSDLRIATLPPEFNFCDIAGLPFFRRSSPAPRVVHYFGRKPSGQGEITPANVLGPATVEVIEQLTRSDHTLHGADNRTGGKPIGRLGKRWLQARALAELAGFRIKR